VMQHPESMGQDIRVGAAWSSGGADLMSEWFRYSGGASLMSEWSNTQVERVWCPSGPSLQWSRIQVEQILHTLVELVLGRLLGFGHVW
jgi:hypothetical protein